MLPKKLYITNWKIDRDGTMHRAGEVISLNPEEARPLVEMGALRAAKVAERRDVVELPPDFPVREILIQAGLHTLEKIREAGDGDLLAIRRVGTGTVKLIREKLALIEAGL